jgi:hypothetical protein
VAVIFLSIIPVWLKFKLPKTSLGEEPGNRAETVESLSK